MATIRVHKNNNFTVVDNNIFKNKQMSLKAKGLLVQMLSLPDDWNYSVFGLVALSSDGKDSVMSALQELEKFGYLRRERITDEKGKFAGYNYDVYEIPPTGEPYAEKPYAEKPSTENPQQLNTNTLITKESRNKESIVNIVEFLNSTASTAYRATTSKTQSLINARLSEGFTVEDFKTVIRKKCAEWKGSDMEKYLRPETLFGTKFESYLNAPIHSTDTNGRRIDESKDDLDDLF